jgi:hypothetical protein
MDEDMSPAQDKRIRVFNSTLASQETSASIGADEFPIFGQLPAEIRIQIWKHCFPKHRFISIRISELGKPYSPRTEDLPEARRLSEDQHFVLKNCLGNIVSGKRYRLHVAPFEQWSRVLLQVNRETRLAWRSFYRLSIPLQLGAPSMLQLNPDTDIIEVQRSQRTHVDNLIAFFHDIVAYDPHGVGIAHLALGRDINDMTALASIDLDNLYQVATQTISKLLSRNIKTFYPCISVDTDARNMLGGLSYPQGPTHQNRSVPIMPSGEDAQVPSFVFLQEDPRTIETDLSHVAVGLDPRRIPYEWYRFLAKFGVPLPPSIKIRYVIAIWYKPPSPVVGGLARFLGVLETFNERWASWMAQLKAPIWGKRVTEEKYWQLQETLHDAAGAWVFDWDTFGDIPLPRKTDQERDEWQRNMIMDLSEHRPGLMVLNLEG